MSRTIRAAVAATLLLAPAGAAAPAALADVAPRPCTINWTGVLGTDWSMAGNWEVPGSTTPRAPEAGDDVCVGAGTGPAPVLTTAATVRTVTVDPDGTGGPASLTVAPEGVLTVTGEDSAEDLLVGPRGQLVLGGGAAEIRAELLANAGTVAGGGTIAGSLENRGTLTPGAAAAQPADAAAGPHLRVTGDFRQTAAGWLAGRLDEGSPTWLGVDGEAALDGALQVDAGTRSFSCDEQVLVEAGSVRGGWTSTVGTWGDSGRFLPVVVDGEAAGVRPIDVPGAPGRVMAAAGDGRLTFGITAPARTGCDRISGYLVRLHPKGGADATADVEWEIQRGSDPTLTGLVNQQVYEISVQARNRAGHGPTARAEGKPNGPPTATFGVEPAQPKVGEAVTFTSTATDADTEAPPAAEWDLDGDGTYEATGPTVTRTYGSAGTVTVRLRSSDGDGAVAVAERALAIAAAPDPAPEEPQGPPPGAEPPRPPAGPPPVDGDAPGPPPVDGDAPGPPAEASTEVLDPDEPQVTVGRPRAASRVVRVPLANGNPFPVQAIGVLRTRGRRTPVGMATPRLLGLARATVPAEGTARLRFRLSRASRRLLVRQRHLRTTLVLRLSGPLGAPVTVRAPLTLR